MTDQQDTWLRQRLRELQQRGVDLDLLRAHRRLAPEQCLEGLETFMAETAALRRDFDASTRRPL